MCQSFTDPFLCLVSRQRNLWVGKKYEDIARLFVKEKKTRKRNRDEMEGSSSNDILEDFADQ